MAGEVWSGRACWVMPGYGALRCGMAGEARSVLVSCGVVSYGRHGVFRWGKSA